MTGKVVWLGDERRRRNGRHPDEQVFLDAEQVFADVEQVFADVAGSTQSADKKRNQKS